VPRYYFHVKRGQMTVLDQDGIDLDNDAQAEKEAAHRVQRIVGDSDRTSSGMLIVADENWRRIFELPF
jgi:aspartate oxidase